jgi:hypothetical protein
MFIIIIFLLIGGYIVQMVMNDFSWLIIVQHI